MCAVGQRPDSRYRGEIAMYQTTLTSLSPPRGGNGEPLIFIGDFPAQVGDTIWTDGKVIYGHRPRYNVPIVSSSHKGIPVVYGLESAGDGYFGRSGSWHDADLIRAPLVVNDAADYLIGQSLYYDAVVHDGLLIVAKKVDGSFQIIQDPDGTPVILDVISPPTSGDTLDTFIFNDDLSWTIWGRHNESTRETLKVSPWVEIYNSGFTVESTDYYSDHATAHYRFNPLHVITRNYYSYQYHSRATKFVLKSDGTSFEYDVNEQKWVSGTEVTGGIYTGPVTGLSVFDDLGNAGLWEGTCDCTSYFKVGNEFAWFGPEPLSNINVVQYYSDQAQVEPTDGETWQNQSYAGYSYQLQNGYHVAVDPQNNVSTLYDGDKPAYALNGQTILRAAAGFNEGGLVLTNERRLLRYGEESQDLGIVRNYKLNYLRRINKALDKKEE